MLQESFDNVNVGVVIKPVSEAVGALQRVYCSSGEVRLFVNWEVHVNVVGFQDLGDGLRISVLHRARKLLFDWQVSLDRIESGRRRDKKQQADKLEHFLLESLFNNAYLLKKIPF